MNDWENSSYLSLSTQKRDGSWVETPVWFAGKGDIFYLFSEGKAGKVKRIRNFEQVKICPCNVIGKITGTSQAGKAEIIQDTNETHKAHDALLQRYGWKMRLLDLGSTIAGKINKRAYLKITLQQ